MSKKQSAVRHSTPEAEIVAADTALRTLGLPGMDLWDKVFENVIHKPFPVEFMEDNESANRKSNPGRIRPCDIFSERMMSLSIGCLTCSEVCKSASD